MDIVKNIPLKKYTSFYIGGPAENLLYAQDAEEIIEGLKLAKQNSWPVFLFSGGSNILVSDLGLKGLAIKIETVGIDIEEETDNSIVLKIASGEVWDDVVRFATDQNWWGIENLSHIPGFTGAFAVQNVGAYGQEASKVITKLDCYDRETGQLVTLSNEDCNFTYRHSIFNTTQKNRYVILYTYLQLSKTSQPNLTYKDLEEKFGTENNPNIKEIRKAIIEIRNSKIPFPDRAEVGNAGSFFRGPLLNDQDFDELIIKLKADFSDEVSEKLTRMKSKFKVPGGYKTPAAFLIDLCGLKGTINGGVKINETHPAVIINFTGEALAKDVLELYKEVKAIVQLQTGVSLDIEPQLVGFSEDELASLLS